MAVLVGKKAPAFWAPAVVNGNEIVENFSLTDYVGKKYVVFFFYPADFTFVCPTELHAFQQTPKKEGGIQGVTYPIVADHSLTISMAYDVLAGEFKANETGAPVFEGSPEAYRGLFLIDKQGIVRHQVINDMPLGRSVEEALRVIDALQFTEQYGEVCPADWHKGDKGLSATQEGIASFLSEE
jgi:peroxiredoxin (alkyl hydroperoxide reductase subunit C)